MSSNLIRYAVLLGIVGSWAIAPVASAQIAVTGGRITGDAAFFVPSQGNTVFFDAGTRTLRLETPNGVTVDSRFVPNGGGIDPIGNRLPISGDRGFLNGVLSGRGFDPAGNPFPFTNVPTTLNFTLTSFNSNVGSLIGSLIEPSVPGLGSRVFLPVLGVTLDSTSNLFYTVSPGTLAVGAFDARLPSGTIGLPPSVRFGTPNNVTEFSVPDTTVLSRRDFSFSLEGQGIANPPGTLGDPSGSFFDPFSVGGVRFSSGIAQTSFSIQLQGTPLVIRGTGTVSTVIEIAGIDPSTSASSSVLPGNNPLAPVISYSVAGTGSGTTTNSEPLTFRSDNSIAAFSFRDQLGNYAVGYTQSNQGRIYFQIAGAQAFTASSFSNLTPDPSYNSVTLGNVAAFVAAPVIPPASLTSGTVPGRGGGSGGSTVSSTGGGSGGSSASATNSTTSASNPTSSVANAPTIPVVFIPGFNPVLLASSAPTSFSVPIAVGLPSRVYPGLIGVEQVTLSAPVAQRGDSIALATQIANQAANIQSSDNPIASLLNLQGNLSNLSTKLTTEALIATQQNPTASLAPVSGPSPSSEVNRTLQSIAQSMAAGGVAESWRIANDPVTFSNFVAANQNSAPTGNRDVIKNTVYSDMPGSPYFYSAQNKNMWNQGYGKPKFGL